MGTTKSKPENMDINKLKDLSVKVLQKQDSGQADAKLKTNQTLLQRRSFAASSSSDNLNLEEASASSSLLSPVDYSERVISCEYGPTIHLGNKNVETVDAQILFKYDILELLGGGTYAQVFLCRKVQNKKKTTTSSRKLVRQQSLRTTSLEMYSDKFIDTQLQVVTDNLGADQMACGDDQLLSLAAAAPAATPALAPTLVQQVAMKIIPKVEDADAWEYAEYERQMRQEATILQRVSSHGHIVKLLEFVEGERNYYMLMECCRHSCMKTIVDCHYNKDTDYTITERSICLVFEQLLDALAYCHSMNIAHLDVKPDNVLLGQDFQVRLCDFGLAVDNAPCERAVHTWLFCPPEIIKEKRAYCNSDCWAAGVVLFVLLSGFFPFHTMSGKLEELQTRIKAGPDFVLSQAPMSNAAKDLLRSLLDTNPNTRISAKRAMKHNWFQTANDEDLRHHTKIVQSLKQLTEVPEGNTGSGSGIRLQHTITTAQLYFTHRLNEVEDMFA